MVTTYLDIINAARDTLGQGTIPLTQLSDTNAEVKKARAAVQSAVKDLFAKHTSIPTENFVATIVTVPATALLTNLSSNPWDTKMVRDVFYLDPETNNRRKLLPVTLSQSKDLALITFEDNTPQFYYQSGNDLYVIPTPAAATAYTLYVRYSRTIPLIKIADLSTALEIDNEGVLVLEDLTKAYLIVGKDPEWKAYLALAQQNAQDYYHRLNSGLQNQGVQSIMRVRSNSADLNY